MPLKPHHYQIEYPQLRIKYAKRDDKCIIWKCRVQKGLAETWSSPSFFQCLCEFSFPSAIAGSHCVKSRHWSWAGACPVPSLGLPAQSHLCAHTPTSGLHSLTFTSCSSSTSSEVSKFNLYCSCCKYPLGMLGRMLFSEAREVGAQLAVSHSPLISCELRGREAAQ